MNHRNMLLKSVVFVGLIAATLPLIGCNNQYYTEADLLRSNLSPELHSQSLTEGQFKNKEAIALDSFGRFVNDDLSQMFFTNRPSVLSRSTRMDY